MVTQKMISFKVDLAQLEKLDKLCDELGCNRNKFLNFLVSYGTSMLDNSKMFHLLSVYSRCFN